MINKKLEIEKGRKYLDSLVAALIPGDLVRFKSHNHETKSVPYQVGRFLSAELRNTEYGGYDFRIQAPHIWSGNMEQTEEKICYSFFDPMEGDASQSRYVEKIGIDEVLAVYNEMYRVFFQNKKAAERLRIR